MLYLVLIVDTPEGLWDVSNAVMYNLMVSQLISPREGGLLVQLMVSLLGVLVTLSCIHLMGKCMSHGQG